MKSCRHWLFVFISASLLMGQSRKYSILPNSCLDWVGQNHSGNWVGLFCDPLSTQSNTTGDCYLESVTVTKFIECPGGNFGPEFKAVVKHPDAERIQFFIRGIEIHVPQKRRIEVSSSTTIKRKQLRKPHHFLTTRCGIFKGQPWALEISTNENQGRNIVDYSWRGSKQRLVQMMNSDGGYIGSSFVGDIDYDGEPDLILFVAKSYVSYVWRFYLSSAKENPNQLLRQVASYSFSGE